MKRILLTCVASGLLLVLMAGSGCPGGADTTTPDDTTGGGGGGGGDTTTTFATGVVIPDPATVAALPQAINPFATSAVEVPAATDLTAKLPPIGNQGQMGSCTAWASAYAGASYTANLQYGWGATSNDHQASPAFLYAYLLAAAGSPCNSGTSIQTAVNLLVQEGCGSLQNVPYSDTQCLTNPTSSDTANFRVGSFYRVDPTDRNAVKAELAHERIVVFGGKLYTDFFTAPSGDVYVGNGELMMSGQQHAAHAMALVGYDDSKGAYRIMNSWGTSWADAGFLWMAYETFEATVFEAYSLEPSDRRTPDPEPEPIDEPTEDPKAYLDDAYQFAEVDSDTGNQNVYLVFVYHFSRPVLIKSVTVTDPHGAQGVQNYNTWFLDGYVYFLRTAFAWEAGNYGISFDVETKAGKQITYTGEARIAALGEDIDEDCTDTCIFAYDGECDDGGPNSDYAVCDLGTDCTDCQQQGDLVCDDSCYWAGDGVCDDGGPGSEFSACTYGTDCTDCGSRSPDGGGSVCENTCEYAFDGECDDGGSGSDYAVCGFGTDCFDCGARSGESTKAVRKERPAKSGRSFRGVPIRASLEASNLPVAPMDGSTLILGSNRQPIALFVPAPQQ